MFFKNDNISHIKLFADTDIGKVRKQNEDSVASLIVTTKSYNKEINYGILVVADGMGGHEKGEVASEMATKKFIEEVTQNILNPSQASNKLNFSKILKKSIASANNLIWELSEELSISMGTTIVGAIIVDNNLFIANVGDSRAYLVAPKKSLFQITKDHSAVQEMLDAKIITKEHALRHPQKNLITKALGLSEYIEADIFEEKLNDRILLLCTDGFHGMISDHEIINNINGNLYNSVEELIYLANKHGGEDNISVALASYSE